MAPHLTLAFSHPSTSQWLYILLLSGLELVGIFGTFFLARVAGIGHLLGEGPMDLKRHKW